MIIINPIPGQEEQNAEFLEKAKIGVWLKKENNVIEDDNKLMRMKENTKKIANKTSTKDICEIILRE